MTVTRKNHGRSHTYWDGEKKLPGVTTIISNGYPKGALIDWAGKTTANYAIDHWAELEELPPTQRLKQLNEARFTDRDSAANRGRDVHRYAEALVAGERVKKPDDIAGHIESYVRFLDEFEPHPIVVEGVVINRQHGYAGTLDLIADIGEERWLLDIKTSRSGVFGDVALQLAAYRYAESLLDEHGQEKPMLDVHRTGSVHVRADGYSLIPVEAGPQEFRMFLYVQQVAWFTERASYLLGEPMEAKEPFYEATREAQQ